MHVGWGGRKLNFHYRCTRRKRRGKLRLHRQRLADRLFRQRGHDLEASGLGVQSVFGQVLLEQAFVVHHGREVLRLYEHGVSEIVFQPAIQGQDFVGTT